MAPPQLHAKVVFLTKLTKNTKNTKKEVSLREFGLMFESEFEEGVAATKAEFLTDIGTVSLYCPVVNKQFVGDLAA